MNRQIVIPVLLTALMGSTALYARQTAAPEKRRLVTTDADMVTNKPLPSGENLTTLNGSVVINSEDSTLHTDKATYNGETQIATAPTRLRLDDKQNTLTADKGIAYYSTRDADFTGNVVINVRPKQSSTTAPKGSLRRDFKDPVTITCGKVRYNWNSKKAVLTQNLVIKQKDRTITGDRGLYDGATETVTLVGNIKSRRPTGEAGDAPGANSRLVACFKEGEEFVTITKDPSLKGRQVRGVVPVREKPNGEVEVIESIDTIPPAPETSPAPGTPPVPVPVPSPATPPQEP